MASWLSSIGSYNWITIALAVVVAASAVQGVVRGASASARHLLLMLAEALATVLALLLAWKLASWASPQVQTWLASLKLDIPAEDLGALKQLYYTLMTSMRDFSLLRYGILFVLGYCLIKRVLYIAIDPLMDSWMSGPPRPGGRRGGFSHIVSSLAGGVIGCATGIGRSLVIIAVLFIAAALFPQTPAADYIQASALYQKGAGTVIKPVTGDFFENRLPVFTKAVEQEFSNILQRKYEVLDAKIPNDIAEAAKEVTAKGKTDEEKARLLYDWVGTRVQYDWDKVDLYEQQRIWKEQTPEQTFATRKGVCIDYSRLYAVMARSVGIDVKVVTGLGFDGKGSYGPHAWNEVYLSDKEKWVPLDSTWVSSGGNWFNPPNFNETHIREV
ncbi:Transglutaminase-like superfamily protein [Paenibacillus konkukensis]|uniref:Transglutaminase-like superfamily protein n=1 Tax=Paenibacillus konkukensis TaxID=2020716 RepID=A0ABY4RWN6_9BACL|nr:transglutaminase-like domain-containing protein [Paenibacillus konkukensis]UQZ86195.1 Transglutaminase-like superfamily protein [Paenibacillus konkukensis]